MFIIYSANFAGSSLITAMSHIMDTPHISAPLRKVENLHILLWLIKDTCWALVWRPGGMLMILPTVGVAFYLMARSRHDRTELYHNIAVCMWILANSSWMTGEFYNYDLRPLAVGFFSIGLLVLLVYYIFLSRRGTAVKKPEQAAIDN
ncbi:hypothetical protein GCM10023093_12610 [Nemorincola caseinilytica]|uniref:Uncharacterized protein n=1 Tax=Nemorincola caseinilytica TaxID=2054315 RepID=A0ABP8NCP1_9BACT